MSSSLSINYRVAHKNHLDPNNVTNNILVHSVGFFINFYALYNHTCGTQALYNKVFMRNSVTSRSTAIWRNLTPRDGGNDLDNHNEAALVLCQVCHYKLPGDVIWTLYLRTTICIWKFLNPSQVHCARFLGSF